jgi:molybdopterin/thiamine biosynthesis adenylyltransferase
LRLAQSRVMMVGMGGLGCVIAPWLVRAGVGTVILVDEGRIDAPDLGRQLLYTASDLGRSKVAVAARVLAPMNPDVTLAPMPLDLTPDNADALLAMADVVVDGTDRLEPRRLMNRAAVLSGRPVVFGACAGWAGQVFVRNRVGPCWDCVFPDPPTANTCQEVGVMGPVVGWTGAVQATETLRVLLGLTPATQGRLLTADFCHGTFRALRVRRRLDCPTCRQEI